MLGAPRRLATQTSRMGGRPLRLIVLNPPDVLTLRQFPEKP